MPSPQKLGPTVAQATGWSRTNDSKARTVFMGRSRLNPPTASLKRSGSASAKRCALSSVPLALVMRMARSTPLASMSSSSSGSSGLLKKESPPLK